MLEDSKLHDRILSPKKIKILYDVTFAMFGYSGIPQEARLMFKMFCKSDQIEPSAVVFFDTPLDKINIYQSFSNFIFLLPKEKIIIKSSVLGQIKNAIIKGIVWPCDYYAKRIKKIISIKMPQTSIFHNTVWRSFFSKSISSSYKSNIMKRNFYIVGLNPYPNVESQKKYKIDDRHDFIIYQGMKCASNSDANIISIARYIDSFPIEEPDAVGSCDEINSNMIYIKHIKKNHIIVCISNVVKETLLKICPEIHPENIFVIHVNIMSYKKSLKDKEFISRVLSVRCESYDMSVSGVLEDYILCVASLQPLKNLESVLQSWHMYRLNHKSNIKLIVIGSVSWKDSALLKKMEPYIKDHQLFIVKDLSFEEMEFFYSNAKMFISLSFNEGFGCPALEAMSCECPTLVSDIPTHREIYGKASLYCDPYDVNDVAQKIHFLLGEKNESQTLRKQLLEEGLMQIKKYSDDILMKQWNDLFDLLLIRRLNNKIYY